MVNAECTALARKVRKGLEELQHQLTVAHAGATIVVKFLKGQDAEQDWDAALVVERCIDQCLFKQISETDDLIAVLDEFESSNPEDSPPS